TAEDQLRAELITALMCHGEVRFAEFEDRHGIHFQQHFAAALNQLEEMREDDLIEIKQDALRVRPAGRLMMRNLAMAFDAYLVAESGRFSRTV
ncbi:MAG: coproporphyrinogen III oxidase, partial [Pseudomonadota bacterium]|nr:coproporphyrinogen III oxidase [Pseudomonadota bacterium]